MNYSWVFILALVLSASGCGLFKSHREIFNESVAKGKSVSFTVEAPFEEVDEAVVNNFGYKGYTRHIYLDEADGFIVLIKDADVRLTLRDQGRMTHSVMIKFTDAGGGGTHVEMVNRSTKPLARMEVQNDILGIQDLFDKAYPAEG